MGIEFPAEKRFLIKLMTPAHGIPCGGALAFFVSASRPAVGFFMLNTIDKGERYD